MSQNILDELTNAVLDLQSSQLQTYERPLKRLASLLKNEEIEAFTLQLTKDVDLEKFLAASSKTAGGMVGSHKLLWPEDQNSVLGLTILLIYKFSEDPRYVLNFAHDYYYSGSKIIAGIHSLTSQLIIPFVRDLKLFINSKKHPTPKLAMTHSIKVFIVHGHDEGARESVARFIERVGLEPIILHEQANQGRSVIEKVEAHGDVGFAVVLLTPDDEGCSKGGTPESRARQNVLLELGYFMGRLGRDRVCTLKKGQLEIPSDFAGVVWEPMDSSGGWRLALARELQTAGYSIDWNKVMK